MFCQLLYNILQCNKELVGDIEFRFLNSVKTLADLIIFNYFYCFDNFCASVFVVNRTKEN